MVYPEETCHDIAHGNNTWTCTGLTGKWITSNTLIEMTQLFEHTHTQTHKQVVIAQHAVHDVSVMFECI